jgi:4-amino-4-deoxy-L-arabinose transferase-like glycosyltransferase
VLAAAGTYEIVLVDDGSTDGTAEVAAAALGDDAQHLRVVRHEQKRGYAATVCDGLSASEGNVLAFVDGDGQFDPADIGRLLGELPDADLVTGYRAHRADPWHRSVVSGVMNLLVRILYGVRWRDVDCGLKVFKREVYTAALPLLATSALFNTELYFKAQRLGFRIRQLPVTHRPRLAGVRSGARLVPILRAVRDVVRLRVRLARRWSPTASGRRDAPVDRAVADPSLSDGAALRPPRRAWLWALPGAAALVLLRLPSFWEPHWYTDEAGYVTTAQSLLRGHVIYSQIWTNKPPLDLWIIAAVVRVFGASEAALHTLTLVSALLTLGAIFWAATRILGRRRAAVATLLAAIALGLPVLDAELALPEALLIAPVTWAGAIIAVRLATRAIEKPRTRSFEWWPVIAGALVAAGLAIQQTVLAELLAFTIALAISPRVGLRNAATFLGTTIVLTLAWLLPVIAIAGAHNVAFALVGFYIPFTQSVLPSSASGQLRHFAEVFIGAILVAGGAFLRRHGDRPTWFFVLWAGATLLVSAAAGQPYAHYLIPAVAPVALTLASIPVRLAWRSWQGLLRSSARVAPQLTGLVIAGVMGSVAGLDWVTPASPSPQVNASRNLNDYYGGALATAIRVQPRAEWDSSFDSRVSGDQAVANWLETEGLDGATAVVWSSDAWVYALADLQDDMPTPPIYNDEVLLGINGQVATYVAGMQPVVIVTSLDAVQEFPEIQHVLNSGYTATYFTFPDTIWVRTDIASQLP